MVSVAEALVERDRFETMLASIGDAVITTDRQGVVTFMNPVAERLTGREAAWAQGRSLEEVFRTVIEQTGQRSTPPVEQAMRQREIVRPTASTLLVARDGTQRPIEDSVAPLRDQHGQITGAVLVFRDVTERQRIAGELRDTELFRELTQSIHEVFWLVDWQAQRVIYVSPAYERVWGQSVRELYEDSKSWRRMVHPDDVERVAAKMARANEAPVQMEYRLLRGEGEIRWIHANTFPVRNINGQGYRVAGIMEDITERRAAEDLAHQREVELSRISRLGQMGEMASGVAHELNQPLSAIASYAHGCLLRLETESGEQAIALKGAIERIQQQSLRAGRILHRLRDFARRGDSVREWTCLNQLAEEVVELLKSEFMDARIEVVLELGEHLPKLLVDRVEIDQVLVNLLHNAIQAMEEGRLPVRRVTIRTELVKKKLLALTVSDTGPGLTDEQMGHLFEPFFTTKPSGMGIGLNICETIAEHHGGTLRAKRNDAGESGGLSFRMELPVEEGKKSNDE